MDLSLVWLVVDNGFDFGMYRFYAKLKTINAHVQFNTYYNWFVEIKAGNAAMHFQLVPNLHMYAQHDEAKSDTIDVDMLQNRIESARESYRTRHSIAHD